MVAEITRFAAEPMHRRRRKPEIAGDYGENWPIEGGRRRQDIHILSFIEIGRDGGQTVDVMEQAIEVISWLIVINHGDRPRRPAGAYRTDGLPHQIDRGSAVRAAHVGQGERRGGAGIRHAANRLEYERRRATD